jgi:hypothetical protein
LDAELDDAIRGGMILLYTTGDYRFAYRAIDALRNAEIPCYTIPPLRLDESEDHLTSQPEVPTADSGVECSAGISEEDLAELRAAADASSLAPISQENDSSPILAAVPPTIEIYADQDSDYQRASEILLKLGAVRGSTLSAKSVERLNLWTLWLLIVTVAVIVLFMWESR